MSKETRGGVHHESQAGSRRVFLEWKGVVLLGWGGLNDKVQYMGV